MRSAEAAISDGDLESALSLIRAQIEGWLSGSELTRNAIWGSRELDALAVRVGKIIARLTPPPVDVALPRHDATRPLDVYLFTKTEVGGHVGVAGDFVRAAPDRLSVVILTEQDVVPVPAGFAERFATSPDRIICLPPASLLDRTRALISVLARLRPERVFLFNHHQDVSIVAAAGSGVVPAKTYYLHHCDFLPALGVFMPGAVHLDVTPRAHTFCGSVLGIPSTYTPLVAADHGRRSPAGRTSGAPVLATCGSDVKYDLSYRLPYHDVVAALLSATDASLYHIGPLRDHQLDAIRSALHDAGVDPSRWRHIPFVASVWDAMDELGVDLYVNSFPQRGARVAVEVMGSGTPAVWHLSGSLYESVDMHLAYPQASGWSNVAELIAIVKNLDAAWIESQGDAARAHYERVHHPSMLAEFVARGFPRPPAAPRNERLFAFEFEQLEQSWHRLTNLIR